MNGEQLKMDFRDGGMRDSGMEKDPVSGNEIPPGSTAKEVRDDVEAQLSEGEYVLPADVVQFLGLDKIEKLVQKAKESLGDMESRGRIGGKVETEDDLPFSDEELQTTDGDTATLKMAEGGLATPQFNPEDYALGGGGVQTKMYVNAEGVKRPFLFINGSPVTAIPEGFVPDNDSNPYKANEEEEDLSTSGDLQVSNSSGDDREESGKSIDFSEMTNEELSDYAGKSEQGLGIAQSLAKSFAGPAGVLIGGLIQSGVNASNSKAVDEINARLQNNDLDKQTRENLEKSLSALQDKAKNRTSPDPGGLLGGLLGGDRGGLLGGLLGGEGEYSDTGGLLGGFFGRNDSLGRGSGIFDGDGFLTDMLGGRRKSGGSSSSTSSGGNNNSSGGGRTGYSRSGSSTSSGSSRTSTAPTSSSRPSQRPSSVERDVRSRAGTQEAPNNDYDSSGPFAKGGLVKKVNTYKDGGLVKRRK